MAGALARAHVGGACGNPLCIDDTRRVYPSRALLRQDAANTPVLFGFGRRCGRGWRVPVHRGNIDFASLTIPVLHGLGSIPWRSRVSAAALDDASRSAPKARSAGAVWRTGGAAHTPVLFGFGRRCGRGWRVPVHRGNIDFASLTIPVLHGLGSIP